MAEPKQKTYTLYHNFYSICSIMVRYTLALRGPAKDDASAILVEEKEVDIFHEEQLTEHFLSEINPKGQVPVLTSPALDKPIADSLEITHYLASLYPALIPSNHAYEINRLLHDLHALNYFSLSFSGRPQAVQGVKTAVQKRLNGDLGPVSDRYRRALEYKMSVFERDKIGGLKPEVINANVEKVRPLMEEFESFIAPEWNGAVTDEKFDIAQGPWLFGLAQPTALDAHLVVFIARMRDIGRGDALIPERLGKYADAAMERKSWHETMQGRATMIGVSRRSIES